MTVVNQRRGLPVFSAPVVHQTQRKSASAPGNARRRRPRHAVCPGASTNGRVVGAHHCPRAPARSTAGMPFRHQSTSPVPSAHARIGSKSPRPAGFRAGSFDMLPLPWPNSFRHGLDRRPHAGWPLSPSSPGYRECAERCFAWVFSRGTSAGRTGAPARLELSVLAEGCAFPRRSLAAPELLESLQLSSGDQNSMSKVRFWPRLFLRFVVR
jgi:hypothetical protein